MFGFFKKKPVVDEKRNFNSEWFYVLFHNIETMLDTVEPAAMFKKYAESSETPRMGFLGGAFGVVRVGLVTVPHHHGYSSKEIVFSLIGENKTIAFLEAKAHYRNGLMDRLKINILHEGLWLDEVYSIYERLQSKIKEEHDRIIERDRLIEEEKQNKKAQEAEALKNIYLSKGEQNEH